MASTSPEVAMVTKAAKWMERVGAGKEEVLAFLSFHSKTLCNLDGLKAQYGKIFGLLNKVLFIGPDASLLFRLRGELLVFIH